MSMRYGLFVLIVAMMSILLTGCPDPVPDDYIPELVIEGFVIAGEPITGIKVYRSLPVKDTFKLSTASIRDAQVTLLENGVPLAVEFVDDSNGGTYRVVDTTHLALYDAEYSITVQAIGKTATAVTQTMKPFQWVRPPADSLQYPGLENELEPVDSLGISWQGQTGVIRYVLAIECLDTLNYGAYLQPPTTELNRRVREEDFEEGSLVANERTRYGFSLVSNSPVVWFAFKWFGKQRIKVYAGDEAFQEWFSAVGFGRRNSYDYRLSNVKGGLGTFAGASRIQSDLFLYKDKP